MRQDTPVDVLRSLVNFSNEQVITGRENSFVDSLEVMLQIKKTLRQNITEDREKVQEASLLETFGGHFLAKSWVYGGKQR